jgi:hypothetical protein
VNEAERAEREQAVRKVGLYLGPMVLASLVAGGIYRSLCGGQQFALGGVFGSNDIFNVGFALVASLLAWSIREPRARLAFAILAVQLAVLPSGSILPEPVSPLLIGSLSVAFAILVTSSGASTQPKWRVIVPAVFAAMFVFRWVTLYYADGIIGRQSVFRAGPFC